MAQAKTSLPLQLGLFDAPIETAHEAYTIGYRAGAAGLDIEGKGWDKAHGPLYRRWLGGAIPVKTGALLDLAYRKGVMHGSDDRNGHQAQATRITYMSPDGLDQWTGRGQTPLWVKELLKSGWTVDQLKLKKI